MREAQVVRWSEMRITDPGVYVKDYNSILASEIRKQRRGAQCAYIATVEARRICTLTLSYNTTTAQQVPAVTHSYNTARFVLESSNVAATFAILKDSITLWRWLLLCPI